MKENIIAGDAGGLTTILEFPVFSNVRLEVCAARIPPPPDPPPPSRISLAPPMSPPDPQPLSSQLFLPPGRGSSSLTNSAFTYTLTLLNTTQHTLTLLSPPSTMQAIVYILLLSLMIRKNNIELFFLSLSLSKIMLTMFIDTVLFSIS